MPTPVTDPDVLAQLNAPDRAPVPSTARSWGDAEGVAAGLYEPTKKPVTDPALLRQLNGGSSPLKITVNPVASRFAESPAPKNAAELQPALESRADELTRGPESSPAAQMAVDAGNQLSAASQGTTPNVGAYKGKLLSTETLQDDAGNIQFRDPQTGQIVQTDNSKHVALRDPRDNTVKVYARSDATDEGALTGVSRVLSPGLGAGAPVGKLGSVATKFVNPTSKEIIETAKPSYRAFDAVAENTPIYADEAKIMVDRVQNALDTAHLPSEVAKQVHDTVALIGKKGDTALSQLQYVKRAVGNLFKSPDENVRSGAGVATKEIMRIISELSPTAAADLKKADAIRQTGRAKNVLETNADVASLRTGRAGYGGNAVNNMRTFVEKIAEQSAKGHKTPFKPDEIQAMRDIVDGNWLTNTLRNVGAMAPSKGILAIGAGIGTLGTTAAIGSLANKLATILTKQQLNRLEELVSKRSPAYREAVSRAVDKFNKAQSEIASKPSTQTLAQFIAASRALSSGLQRDGIQITSGELIRQLTGPIKTAADEQQQPVQGPPGQ